MRARTLVFLFATLAAPIAAHAQDDSGEAKKQFIAGSKAFSAGKFAEAATAFEAAAAIKPNAVALYTAALAWEQASQSERAADDYGRALDLPGGGLNPQQETTAKDRLTALEKVLGTLTVAGPDGTKVQLDGFTETLVPARLHGLGGTHSLSVKVPSKQPEKREITLDGGQLQKLDLTPQAPKPPQQQQQVVEQPKPVVVEKPAGHVSPLKALGWASIGIGGTSALVAILLGLSAENSGDAYKAAPSHAGYVEANALADWTTVAWITAGVFVAAGVTLVLIPEGKASSSPPPDAAPKKDDKTEGDTARLVLSPTIGGLVLRGSF